MPRPPSVTLRLLVGRCMRSVKDKKNFEGLDKRPHRKCRRLPPTDLMNSGETADSACLKRSDAKLDDYGDPLPFPDISCTS
jgi:hypothetical protein